MRSLMISMYWTEAALAAHLVRYAPARARLGGVWMRAKYATTRPEDVVTQYRRNLDAQRRTGIYARPKKP